MMNVIFNDDRKNNNTVEELNKIFELHLLQTPNDKSETISNDSNSNCRLFVKILQLNDNICINI